MVGRAVRRDDAFHAASPMTSSPYAIGRPIDGGIHWGRAVRRDDPKSPGAGRAKLRLSRGFPRCLAGDVIPLMQLADQLTEVSMGGRVLRRDDAKSPGAGR